MQHPAPTLPSTIDDSETIIRALKTPAHYDSKKGKLKAAAFRPPVGKSVVSVMRQLIGDDHCKDQAVLICSIQYVGLAALTADKIRESSSQILDAPQDFYGHAHIDHGFPAPVPNEPAVAEESLRATLRYKFLADASICHIDQSPKAKGWTGLPLKVL